MSHRIERSHNISAEFSWGAGAGMCRICAQTSGDAYMPAEGSLPQFITEHYWGYAVQPDGRTAEYQVEHPQWKVLEAPTAQFAGDGEKYYGPEFAKVLEAPPDSAFLATGWRFQYFRKLRPMLPCVSGDWLWVPQNTLHCGVLNLVLGCTAVRLTGGP